MIRGVSIAIAIAGWLAGAGMARAQVSNVPVAPAEPAPGAGDPGASGETEPPPAVAPDAVAPGVVAPSDAPATSPAQPPPDSGTTFRRMESSAGTAPTYTAPAPAYTAPAPAYPAASAPSSGSSGGGAGRLNPNFSSFEVRFGGSFGFAQLDTGVGLHRSMGYGGFVGLEFQQGFAQIGEQSAIFATIYWDALDFRYLDPDANVAGGTSAGIGPGFRFMFAPDAYIQAWAGYYFIGDSQAVYSYANDLLAFWHLAYLRARLRLGFLIVDLAGGVNDFQQHALVGLRAQLGGEVYLGAELSWSRTGREGGLASHNERQLTMLHAFLALRWD